MHLVLIISGLVLFTLLTVRRKEWGIYLIILLLPTYQIRFQVFGVPATFLEIMILLLSAIVLVQDVWLSRTKTADLFTTIRADKVSSIFIFLFLLAALIAVFSAPDIMKAAGVFKAYFFEAILFSFLVRIVINDQKKIERLFAALSLLVLYLSVFGLYQFATLTNLPPSWWDVGASERRITSLVNHPNALALFLGPILAALIFAPKLPQNKLRYSALVFGLPAFYLTLSRAGWLALIATSIIFMVLEFFSRHRGERAKKIGLLALPMTVLVIGAVLLAVPYSRNKLIDLTHKNDPSRQNRIILWSAAADILKHSPILGTGLTGFREAYKNYPLGPDRVIQNYPHNFFLNFWTETGLFGLISIISLLIVFFRKTYFRYQQKWPFAVATAAAMLVIVLHGMVDVPYFKNDLSVLFWLFFSFPWLNLG